MKNFICLILITILTLFSSTSTFAQEKSKKEDVIYKYKKYERFDLGNLEIKGSVVAPGDLSIKERKRKVFVRPELSRENFDDFCIEDIENLK